MHREISYNLFPFLQTADLRDSISPLLVDESLKPRVHLLGNELQRIGTNRLPFDRRNPVKGGDCSELTIWSRILGDRDLARVSAFLILKLDEVF